MISRLGWQERLRKCFHTPSPNEVALTIPSWVASPAETVACLGELKDLMENGLPE